MFRFGLCYYSYVITPKIKYKSRIARLGNASSNNLPYMCQMLIKFKKVIVLSNSRYNPNIFFIVRLGVDDQIMMSNIETSYFSILTCYNIK